MKKISLIILSFVLTVDAYGQSGKISPIGVAVSFFQEEITLSVTDSMASVEGVYHFRNISDIDAPFPVLFPFYVDSLSLYPETIKAYIIRNDSLVEIPFRKMPERNAVMLNIPITPKGITVWHLDYSQRILSPRAKYILTSTASWAKPLEDATYKFVVPEKFDSVEVWPEADEVTKHGDKKIYCAHQVDFMPHREMEIFWKTK